MNVVLNIECEQLLVHHHAAGNGDVGAQHSTTPVSPAGILAESRDAKMQG